MNTVADNITNLSHPLASNKMDGLREFGFDNFEPIHNWVVNQINKVGWSSNILKKDLDHNRFITLTIESHNHSINPYAEITIEIGFVEFNTNNQIVIASVEFYLYKDTLSVSILRAFDENGVASTDYPATFELISNPIYLN